MDTFINKLKPHKKPIGIGVLVIGIGVLIWFLVKSKDGDATPTRAPTTRAPTPSPTTRAPTPSPTPSPPFVHNIYFPFKNVSLEFFNISSPEECFQKILNR